MKQNKQEYIDEEIREKWNTAEAFGGFIRDGHVSVELVEKHFKEKLSQVYERGREERDAELKKRFAEYDLGLSIQETAVVALVLRKIMNDENLDK